jgi:hypothetical protein
MDLQVSQAAAQARQADSCREVPSYPDRAVQGSIARLVP